MAVPLHLLKKATASHRSPEVRQNLTQAAAATATPTEAQREEGNYAKGRLRLHGFDIAIENPKGSIRKGKDWETKMGAHYGYFVGTTGKDGDALDVFVGPEPESEAVFIVDQPTKDGGFDEHKVIFGAVTEQQARLTYLGCYTKGWKCGPVTQLTLPQFRSWVAGGNMKKPIKGQKFEEFHKVASVVLSWHDKSARKRVYAVDLDGTLAHKERGPFNPEHVGDPIPAMLADVVKWRQEGNEVRLFTARAHDPANIPHVQKWLEKHGLGDIKITNQKTPDIDEIHDDRAITRERNTGIIKSAGDQNAEMQEFDRTYTSRDGEHASTCPRCGEKGTKVDDNLNDTMTCGGNHRWRRSSITDGPEVPMPNEPTGNLEGDQLSRWNRHPLFTEKIASITPEQGTLGQPLSLKQTAGQAYDKYPGGFDAAVAEAGAAGKTPTALTSAFPKFDTTKVSTPVPVRHFPFAATANAAYAPDRNEVWKFKNSNDPLSNLGTMSHELTHAAQHNTETQTGKPYTPQRLVNLPGVEGEWVGMESLTNDQRARLSSGLSTDELDPRLADVKRQWAVRNPGKPFTAADADSALDAFGPESWEADGYKDQFSYSREFFGLLKKHNPKLLNSLRPTLKERLMQIVQRQPTQDSYKLASEICPHCGEEAHEKNASAVLLDGEPVRDDEGRGVVRHSCGGSFATPRPPAPSDYAFSEFQLRLRAQKGPLPSPDWTKSAAYSDGAPETGPEAILHALSQMKLEDLEAEAKADLKSGKVTKRPRAVAILNIVQGLTRNGQEPKDLMIRSVPVIPPKFRPFTMIGDTLTLGDANELYNDLLRVRSTHAKLRGVLGDEGASDTALALYDGVRAVYGHGDPVNPKSLQRGVQGMLHKITGAGPKHSWISSRMMAKPQDNVGRSVISVDPDLGIDEVGLPHDVAWSMFKAPIQGALVRQGMSSVDALKAVIARSPQATKALQYLTNKETGRPVVISRAPAWHRHNTVGQWAKLVDGNSLRVNPLITTGSGGDFDGDQQIAKVVVLVELTFLKNNLHVLKNSLDVTEGFGRDTGMLKNQVLPVYDPTTHCVRVIDLEDFPRGELYRSKIGEKGPIDFYHAPKGLCALALDETTGKPTWAPIAFYSVHADREVEIVDTRLGRQIITDDDPRAVYGMACGSIDLALGRFTPTAALEQKVAIPMTARAVDATAEGKIGQRLQISDNADCKFASIEMTWDSGFVFGALAGDGWWDKSEKSFYALRRWEGTMSVHLADLRGFNAQVLDRVFRTWSADASFYVYRHEADTQDGDARYGDTVKYTYNFRHSEILAEFLTQHMGGERDENTSGAANKRLPGLALTANREFREGVFCGLMDTDGSISLSEGKGKPQLMLSFTSTSLRLIRDMQFLALTLGIRGVISFSKETSGGNTSWILTLSSVDAKRQASVFERLQSPWKKEAFQQGEVDLDGPSAQRLGKVPLPAQVEDLLAPHMRTPKISKEERKLKAPGLEAKKNLTNLHQLFCDGRRDNLISKQSALRILESLREAYTAGVTLVKVACEILESCRLNPEIDAARIQIVRDAISIVAPFHGDKALMLVGRGVYARLNKPLRDRRIPERTCVSVGEFLQSTPIPAGVTEHPLVKAWEVLVRNEAVDWTVVTDVQKTGKRETGYDLTVPGYETFANAEGLILSNTMTAHLPHFTSAIEDVKKKLMPSQFVYSDRDKEAIVNPTKHEMVLSLHNAQARPAEKKHVFGSEQEAVDAYRAGKISLQDEFEIGKPMTP